ncbi:MAG: GNAT family N-acetyltransferase [Chloroflexi bacterium]|nr:GNAT family N-acetyltransferase [Chloroflexota bacterium]MBP8054549.1 GNAT family N-acetyltransferase [Chloroflexota bacterium]
MKKNFEFVVDHITIDRIPTLEAIHLVTFPESAITRLGQESIRRYYHWLLTGPFDAFQLGAWINNELVGFCFCGQYSGVLRGFVTNNRAFFIRRLVTHPWLVFNPVFRQRLYLAWGLLTRSRKRGPLTSVDIKNLFKPSFGILAIATHPSWQGRGIGRILMTEAENKANQGGYSQMHLTVHPDNQQAIQFYESLGWHKRMESAVWKGQMVKELS